MDAKMWTALFLVTLAAATCFCALAVLLDAESRLPHFIGKANGPR
jgi:hypothetical protein